MQELGEPKDFGKLNLKKRYTSLDDTLNEFFIPVLAHSRYYYRASGYFSSSVLVAAAKGLSYFVKHGEKMYLITGVVLSQDDVEAINKGLTTPPEIIERNLLKELNTLAFEDIVAKKRLEILAWLVSKGKMEIKIVLPIDENSGEVVVSSDRIWHSKFAIFEDFSGNKIHIEGSINETAQGWSSNVESFSVHRSWISDEKDYIISAEEEFWATWQNRNPKVRSYTIPEAVKRELIKLAPSKLGDIKDPEEKVHLWPHQEEAIDAWYEHERKGILSMATGSGKTLTALFAVKKLPEDSTIMILVPSFELINQWKKEIKRVFGKDVPIIICSSQSSNWKTSLREFIWAYKDRENKKFILSTIKTAISDKFLEIINEELNSDYVLIVDEVHRIGAKKSRRILKMLNPKLGRLGLSATPQRIWDKEGTKLILDFFGGVIYEYSLKDAIRDGRIVPYEYHVEIVTLTDEELYQYKELSRKIYNTYKKILSEYNLTETTTLKEVLEILEDISEVAHLQNLLLKRAAIIKKAINKIPKTIDIIEKNKNKLGRCLIYCQDTHQLNILAEEMTKRGLKFLKYLGIHEKEKKLDHLRLFEEGVINFLLSIRCLDEGVDIPASDSAIILASSTNPREFIQRRGRVLRKAPNKNKAIIYDLFVFPYGENYAYEIEPTEIEIFEKELDRSLIFLESAIDSEDTLIKLSKLYRKIEVLGVRNDVD